MSDTIIPQNPEWPGKNVGGQPAPPTSFDYQILPQPEHLGESLTPNSGQPILPSRPIHSIYPDRIQPY